MFRIHKYASCSNECFILALIYIDRLIQRNNFLLTELNVHRVVITAILLAAKFFDDAYYNNAYYSKVGGVLVSEMNGLEVDFLFRINFSLHVTPEVFEKYKAELVAHSMNAGVTIPPQTPSPKPQMVESIPYVNGTALEQNASLTEAPAASIPISVPQTYHAPYAPHVTPSPSHVANRTGVVVSNSCAHPLYVAEQLVNCGIPQQLMQRANSLPPTYPTHTGRCLHNNPYSAPMVSMLPGGSEDQYILVSNQVFPLTTALVHHHHGVEQAAFYQQQHGGNGYPLTRENFGSLAVAGHY